MSIINRIKRIPGVEYLWRKVRLWRILIRHHMIANICDDEIQRYQNDSLERFSYTPKKDLGNKKVIWQYWDGTEIPELVQICFRSVDKLANDYQIIRLSDDTVSEYIDLPDFLKNKELSKAHYTDILRLALLVAYGGIWLDATVFLSGGIPEQYSKLPLFMFQRDDKNAHQEYWENCWTYYYGWNDSFKVRVLNSVIFAEKGNGTLRTLCDIMVNYLKGHNEFPDYFFFQILFNQVKEHNLIEDIPVVDDCVPHMLQQEINCGYPFLSGKEILMSTTIHKLTYKCTESTQRLKSLIS